MRQLWVMAALVVAPALAAQQPASEDRATAIDTGETARLRQDIENRYAARVRQVLGLSDDQAAKLRATQERFRERRRAIRGQQLGLGGALDAQMRPGVAANPDSVRGLMDRIQANRLDLVQLEQDEDREMSGYLTPVQRAQYHILRERLLQRVAQERYQRGLQGARGLRGAESGGGVRPPPPRQRRPR